MNHFFYNFIHENTNKNPKKIITMAKSQDAKKNVKKAPAKTAKEKKAAKREKKAKRAGSL